MSVKVGALLGQYRIEGEIASGGMGVIYRAIHLLLGRPAAIKVLHSQFSSDPSFIGRFEREARAMARLDHENIIRVFDVAEDQGLSYIVMELFDGKDLKKLIQQEHRLRPVRAVKIALQVARALGYAHSRGIVHRDIKPANILIDDLGNVKITDFGIVAAKGEASMTATGDILGTPIYMSPEQARGDEQDGKTDLYSLGMVMYEMVSGQNPYRGMSQLAVVRKIALEEDAPPLSFPSDVPIALQETIHALLTKRIADRIPDAETLIRQIEAIDRTVDDATLFENAESIATIGSEESKRALEIEKVSSVSFLPYVAGGLVLVLIAAGAFFYTLSRPASKTNEKVEAKKEDSVIPIDLKGQMEASAKYPPDQYIVAIGNASVTDDRGKDREKATQQAIARLSSQMKLAEPIIQKIAQETMIEAKSVEEKATSVLYEVVQKADIVKEETVDRTDRAVAVLERKKGMEFLAKKIEALSQMAREKRRQADAERTSSNITAAIQHLIDERNTSVIWMLSLYQLRQIAGSLALPKIEALETKGIFAAIEAILSGENGLQLSRSSDEKGGAAAVRLTYLKKPVVDFPIRFIVTGGAGPFENEIQTDKNGIAKMNALPCNNVRTIVPLSAAPAYQKLLGKGGNTGYQERLGVLAEAKQVGIQEMHYPCADTCELIGRDGGKQIPGSVKSAGGERIDAVLNKYDFRKGEEVQVQVDVKSASYLYLFNLYQDRSVTLLYPNRFFPDNFLKNSDRLVFPNDQAQKGVKLRVYPSEGSNMSVEKIMILATDKPLNLSQAAIRQAFKIYKAEETGTIDRLTGLASLGGTGWMEKSLTYCVRDGI